VAFEALRIKAILKAPEASAGLYRHDLLKVEENPGLQQFLSTPTSKTLMNFLTSTGGERWKTIKGSKGATRFVQSYRRSVWADTEATVVDEI
jgi:hypothetical protein